MKYVWAAFALAIAFALGLVFGRFYLYEKSEPEALEKVVRDTVFQKVKSEPIEIERVKTKIKIKRDTIIRFKPFVAVTDTIIRRDTVKARYEFPENLFSLSVKKKVDSLPAQIVRVKTGRKKDDWTERSAYALGGVAVGLLIGIVAKRC